MPGDPDPIPDTDFSVTTRRQFYRPYIAQRGTGPDADVDVAIDGQRLDPITGKTEDGEWSVRVIDERGTVTVVACDINSVLIAEESPGMHLDGTAFSSGKWTVVAVNHPLTSKPAANFGTNADGPILGTFALFGWLDPGSWVRETYVEATFDGTEGGGPAFTPGQKVGFRFRVNPTLDTGPGNPFVELIDATGTRRISGVPAGFNFWEIPEDPLNQQVDFTFYAVADASGEVVVRLGGEGMFPSFNLVVQFEDIAVVECEDVPVSADAERYETSWLADADARQQLIERQGYLEESDDDGVTYARVLATGYAKDIEMTESLTFLNTFHDAGRRRRIRRAWRGLDPTEDFSP